jgi:hypothetical protein
MENIGKLIFSIGVILVFVGLVIWLFSDKLGWLGNLPGGIKIERPGFSLYFPIATMLLISLLLSLAMWLIGKWEHPTLAKILDSQ